MGKRIGKQLVAMRTAAAKALGKVPLKLLPPNY